MMSGSAESGGDDSMNDGRKGGKRELSQSKRAAQNRAAQVRSLFNSPPDTRQNERCARENHFTSCGLVNPICFVNSHVINGFAESTLT